jgi:uncharacterized phage-like protein YoqJ
VIVAITGHRPDKLPGGYGQENHPGRCWIREQIRAALIEHKPLYGITGMALGVDTDFAHVCIDQGIPYVAAIPFVGQERVWRPDAQTMYRKLLGLAHEVVVVSEGAYERWKMLARNEWTVDHCNLLLAVWNGTAGGTASCVSYAHRVQKQVHLINPNEFGQTTGANRALQREDSR